jgi:hypothetical protein
MRVVGLFVMIASFALLLGGWLQGQDRKEPPDVKKPPDEPKVKGQLPAGWKKLGLTEDQVQTVYKTQAAYKAKIEAHEKAIADLKTEERVKLLEVLTPEQKTKLKDLKEKDLTRPPDKDKEPDKDK